MSREKRSVRVQILGEDYILRTNADEAHTQAVASYVDKAIRTVVDTGAVVETHKAAILAALQITDELFRARMADQDTAERINSLSRELRRWLPPPRRGDGVSDAGSRQRDSG
jgi:cell division protein ZapA